MHSAKTILFVGILFISTLSLAQKVSFYGFIENAETGERLPGATIYFQNIQKGIVANQYGYFATVLEKGNYEARVSFAGYKPLTCLLKINADTMMVFGLHTVMLKEVNIVSEQESISRNPIETVKLNLQQLREIPPFLGEYDIMKGLALSPGINTGTEGSSGLFVRGGTPDQNLILLDGARIYNNAHLFGFISVFNPEAIQDAELIKNGFPAGYGGRLSSVVNVTMKEGSNKRNQSVFSISPISSQFTIEGPVKNEKSSFLISGRSAYASLIGLPMYLFYVNNKVDTYMNYWLYDLNMKYNLKLSKNRKLFLSLYQGRDVFTNRSSSTSEKENTKLNWGNTTASLRYFSVIKPGLFAESQLTFNKYGFNYFIDAEAKGDQFQITKSSLRAKSTIAELAARQKIEIVAGANHTLVSGVEFIFQKFMPDYFKLKGMATVHDFPDTRKSFHTIINVAGFIEDRFKPGPFNLETGLRLNSFLIENTSFVYAEPRLNLGYKLSKTSSFHLAWSIMHQALHLLSNTGQGLPIDIWAPATKQLPPQNAQQYSAGFNFDPTIINLNFSLGMYYKHLENLTEYKSGFGYVSNLTLPWQLLVEKDGKGSAYGVEMLVKGKIGKMEGWLEYTLAWNNRKFENINNNDWYYAKYDRRHDLGINLSYSAWREWKLNSTFVFTSGQPATLPIAYGEDINGNEIPFYNKRNNLRMPAYHRLDIAFTREFVSRKGRNSILSFGAYNAYHRINPFYIMLIEREVEENGQVVLQNRKYEAGTLFGIMPFISYTVKFE